MNQENLLSLEDIDAALSAPTQPHEPERAEPHTPAPSTALAVRRIPNGAGDANVISVREYYSDLSQLERFARILATANVGEGQEKKLATACSIIRGAELGIPPMAAVGVVHFIKGKPTLSADAMMGVARRAGVRFKITQSNPPGQWCEVSATRGEETYSFRWTLDMAKTAGLGGDNWRKYPWDMLFARCASHVCRKIASDALAGIYEPSELAGPVAEPTGGDPINELEAE